MTETVHHFHDPYLPAGGKDYIEQNLTLNLKPSPLLRVNRTRLECDLSRQGLDDGFSGLGFGLRIGCDERSISKAARANRASRAGNRPGTIAGSHSVAKSGARNPPPDAVRSAGAVAIAWARGHIERARRRNRDRTAVILGCGYAVGLAETPRLHFLRRRRQGRCRRTSRGEHIGLDRWPRDHRLHIGQKLFAGRQRHLGRFLVGQGRFLPYQFGRNAQSFGPRRYRFRYLWLWNTKMPDRRRSLWNRGRDADRSEEVVVTHRQHQNFGVRDSSNQI